MKPGFDLSKPRTMAEVAKLVGWGTRRTRRHMLRLHQESGGSLLVRNGRWHMVSLSRLREVWPDFGKRLATPDDVREMRTEQSRLNSEVRSVARRCASERRLLKELVESMSVRISKLENVIRGLVNESH